MNDKQFDELLDSVRDMGRHMRGQAVAGARVQEFPEPDVKAIRERTGLSQTRFAYLIGVKPKTLQNWEQRRACVRQDLHAPYSKLSKPTLTRSRLFIRKNVSERPSTCRWKSWPTTSSERAAIWRL